MSSTSSPSVDQIQRTNWEGCIPTVVTLAPTSLSSPTVPPSIHVLLSRQTYLHLGLASAIRRLHPFAPSVMLAGIRRQEEPDPGGDQAESDHEEDPQSPTPSNDLSVCWFEDEETQLPLRWHLFAGVLYDLTQGTTLLPWKLRLHFNNYPVGPLLPLSEGQVERQIRAVFSHSLKQAVTLRTGQSKAALQLLAKEAHQTLWQAMAHSSSSSVSLYRQVASNLASKLTVAPTNETRIPVRVLVNTNATPPMQKSCRAVPDLTLGDLLHQWLPDKFPSSMGGSSEKLAAVQWRINGIQPPLEVDVLELWKHLCHADHFLYIIVLSTQ